LASIYESNRDQAFGTRQLIPNKNYVGFSITQGNVYRKKEWPLDNVIKISSKLLEKGKIPVFFIEKKNLDIIFFI